MPLSLVNKLKKYNRNLIKLLGNVNFKDECP